MGFNSAFKGLIDLIGHAFFSHYKTSGCHAVLATSLTQLNSCNLFHDAVSKSIRMNGEWRIGRETGKRALVV